MQILSHRGYWTKPSERNSIDAIRRSLDSGFGIETDVRDCAGRLVISHDMPLGDEVSAEQVLRLFHEKSFPLALNIKADGMACAVKSVLKKINIKDYFVFDMSIPDMRDYLNEGIPVFARVSNIEKEAAWLREAVGLWFDSFDRDSYDIDRLVQMLSMGKRVCVVSPELHHWPCEVLWNDLKPLAEHAGLMLCTDYPERARDFFQGRKTDVRDHDQGNHL